MAAQAERRFTGVARLYGVAAAQGIAAAHVAVVGLGGVGSWAAEALVRSGVGRLTLIDLDHVAESNINRQVQATQASVGLAKVLAMQQRLHLINPDCVVDPIEQFVLADNWPGLLKHPADAVIDACDQLQAKLTLALWARPQRVLLVTVGAAGGKRQAQRVALDDLLHVTHDPLLAQLRNRLRKSHATPKPGKKFGLECVFSNEPVTRPDPSCASQSDGSLNCHGYGSVVSVTATFGLCAAGRVLERLAAACDSSQTRFRGSDDDS